MPYRGRDLLVEEGGEGEEEGGEEVGLRLVVGEDDAVERGQLRQALQRVMRQLRVAPHLPVQLESNRRVYKIIIQH